MVLSFHMKLIIWYEGFKKDYVVDTWAQISSDLIDPLNLAFRGIFLKNLILGNRKKDHSFNM